MEPTAALKYVLEDLYIYILADCFLLLCQIERVIMVCYVEMLETILMIYGPIFSSFVDRKYFLSIAAIQCYKL